MKKINNLKTFISLIVVLSIFSSCLKDNGPAPDYSQSPAVVGFQYKGFSATPYLTSIFGQSTDTAGAEVTLSVPSITLSTAVTVTIIPYSEGLDSFNTAQGTDYVQLPSSLYKIENDGKVTINPGEQTVSFTINFAGDKIDFSKDNGLCLRISDAQGAIVASNLNTAIFPIKLRNPYEGDYDVTGYFVHPTSPRAIAQPKSLVTIDLTTSQGPFADLGGWLFDFSVDADNNLTNYHAEGLTYPEPQSGFMTVTNPTNDPNYPGSPYTDPPYNNTYDPATQTFWMHYGYGSGAAGQNQYSREVFEKWVRQ